MFITFLLSVVHFFVLS